MAIESVVLKLKSILLERNLKIVVAESLTAGLVTSYLASVSGSSGYLRGGVTGYEIEMKSLVLGVDYPLAKACNAYSEDVAHQMALGVRKLFISDVSIATTGYAEPYQEEGINHAQAYIALNISGTTYCKQVFAENRTRNDAREYIAQLALEYLLEELDNLPK